MIRYDRAGFVIAAALLVLAGIILWDASNLRIGAVYGVGPQAMPQLVAAGLVVLAIGTVLMTVREGLPAREPTDLKAILLILGGLLALILIIRFGGGFILATAALFAAVSSAFGRGAYVADGAIGLGLGIAIFLLFDKVLSLSLPAGPLEGLL